MLTIKNPNTFDWENIDLTECIAGNAFDTKNTIIIYYEILKLLQERNLEYLYEVLLSPAASMFAEVEYEGLDVDTEELEKLEVKLSLTLDGLEKELLELAGRPDLNINSDKQLADLLYEDENGFGLVPIKFTEKKSISVDSDVIKSTKAMIIDELSSRQ